MRAANANTVLEALNQGARSAADLGRALGVSQPTISRLLAPLLRGQQVLRIGATRSARYARVQLLPESGADHWPIYRVDARGAPQPWGTLYWLVADQSFVTLHADAQANRELQRLYEGLPYFLQDQRPAGFMGRNVPQRYPELNLPQRVVDWTDTHYLRYLTQQGWDAVSDLIVGDDALNRFLASEVQAMPAAHTPCTLRAASRYRYCGWLAGVIGAWRASQVCNGGQCRRRHRTATDQIFAAQTHRHRSALVGFAGGRAPRACCAARCRLFSLRIAGASAQ